MWLSDLIVFACGSLAASAVWIIVSRRYAKLARMKFSDYEAQLSDKVKEIDEKTTALQQLFHAVHHGGTRSSMASVLGLIRELYWRESKSLKENLKILHRPGHHRYAELATKNLEVMDDYIQKAGVICKDLYDNSAKSAQPYEHLQ